MMNVHMNVLLRLIFHEPVFVLIFMTVNVFTYLCVCGSLPHD